MNLVSDSSKYCHPLQHALLSQITGQTGTIRGKCAFAACPRRLLCETTTRQHGRWNESKESAQQRRRHHITCGFDSDTAPATNTTKKVGARRCGHFAFSSCQNANYRCHRAQRSTLPRRSYSPTNQRNHGRMGVAVRCCFAPGKQLNDRATPLVRSRVPRRRNNALFSLKFDPLGNSPDLQDRRKFRKFPWQIRGVFT